MRTILLALAASAALGSAANAQTYRAAPPPALSSDEWRDHLRDQVERRQEMERSALRMEQKEELRARGLDDDEDDDDE